MLKDNHKQNYCSCDDDVESDNLAVSAGARKATAMRTGFTTGACASAAALSAFHFLKSGKVMKKVSVLFPDGATRDMDVAGVGMVGSDSASAWIIKDAGDDPDVTNGAVIRAQVGLVPAGYSDARDYLEKCAGARMVISAGEGVGLTTKRGLRPENGKWAINPAPRKMLQQNLESAGAGVDGQDLLVVISVDNGRALGMKTLNPVLGIMDGISILGTSGLVIPCSNAAYIETIRMLLDGTKGLGFDTAVLVTGKQTHDALVPLFPDLPEVAFIRIGDHIRTSIEYARELGFRKIVVGCMPGKLSKYAQGLSCTHAHDTPLSLPVVAADLHKMGFSQNIVDKCLGNVTIQGFIDELGAEDRKAILTKWTEKAISAWQQWAPEMEFELVLVDPSGCVEFADR